MSERYVFASVSPGVWGAEHSMLTLAAALQGRGHEVILVCTSQTLAHAWRETVSGSCVLIELDSDVHRLVMVRQFWGHLRELCSRGDKLVLFSYVLAVGALIPMRWPSGRPRVVLDLHDTVTAGFGRLALSASALRLDHIVAVSDFTGSQLFVRRRIVEVLTRPVNRLPFSPPEPAEYFRVGVVGRIAPEKNIPLAIQAVSGLPTARLIVRGAVEEGQSEFANSIKNLGEELLGSRFSLEGALPWSQALTGLDALVVANSTEAMGRTVLEAQLTGITAIVPNRGGAKELVEDGRTGFMFRADDPESLAAQIQRAASGDSSPHITNAREWSVRVSDPDDYAGRYVAAIAS